LRSRTMLRLPAPRMSNRSGIDRMGSPPGGSTFSTSAPCSASSWVAYGPGRQMVRSRTRRPSSWRGSPGWPGSRGGAGSPGGAGGGRGRGRARGGGRLGDGPGAPRSEPDEGGEPAPGSLDLAVAGLPPQGGDPLVDVGAPRGPDGVALRDQAAAHVHGDPTAV